MAFNPFHSMRRNSKAILAVVTIFIMVIFVLSSGIAGGDFFNDFVPRMLGGKGKNPSYAEAFGSNIRASEVETIAAQRVAANQFMTAAKSYANTRAMRRINQQIATPGELGSQTVDVLRQIVADRVAAFDFTKENDPMRRMATENYQLLSIAFAAPERFDRNNPQAQQALSQVSNFLNHRQSLAKADNRKDYEAMLRVENVLRYEGRQTLSQQPYFETLASTKNGNLEDALIFSLFLRKADELGVHYPPNVVNELIQADMMNSLDPTDAALVEQGMRRGGRVFSSEEIIMAIGNEFRVRAVVRLFSQDGQLRERAMEVTPNEFFEFYKDNRTETTLNLVEVPVASFVSKVTAEPKPEELRKLYEQFKTQEYAIGSENPGFRESAKVKVDWISTSANTPYYERSSQVVDGLTRLAAGFLPPNGADPASGIAQIAAPYLWESLKMREVYDGIVSRYNTDQTWDKGYLSDPHDTSRLDRNSLASIAGQLGAVTNPFQAAIHAPLAESVFNHVTRTVETRARVAVGMPFVLAGYNPAAFSLFPALAPTAVAIPQMPSMQAYGNQLRDDLKQGAITRLFGRDADAFKTQLKKIRSEKKDGKDKKPDEIRKEIDTYVQQYIKDRDLKSGKSAELRDRFTLHTDPGLKPLLDREPPPLNPRLRNSWWDAFFGLPQNATATMPGVLFDPHWFPPREVDQNLLRQFGPQILDFFDTPPANPKEVGYLAWRSDFAPPKTWPKYDDAPAAVKAKVLEAWKFQKARELAKAEADRLAEEFRTLAKAELQTKSNAPAFLNTVREKTPDYKKIELTRVSPLQSQESINPTIAREYTQYNLPTKDITFPGNLVTELLDLRSKPVGETIVSTDQPKANYYVVTSIDKTEPLFGTFATDVLAKSAAKTEVDPLYLRYVARRTDGLLFTVIERMKVEAGFKPTEEFTKITSKKETIVEDE